MAQKPRETEEKSNRLIGRRYRYTNDYQVVPALGSDGRGKRIFYIGSWFLPVNEPVEYRKLVLWIQILTAAALAAVLVAVGIIPPPYDHKWYLPILVLGLFPLAFQVMGAVRIPGKIIHMEHQRYDKSIVRAGQSAAFALVVICISALGCLAYWIVAAVGTVPNEAPYAWTDGAFAALLILAAAAEWAVRRLSRKIKIDTLDHDAYHP